MAYAERGYALTQGRVFLAERAFNGALTTGLDWIGDADSVQLTVAQKTQQVKDQFSGKGYTTKNPVVETTITVRINALDARLANWARATWGESGARTGGSELSEAVTLYNGRYLKLARMAVSDVTIVGAVENADFVVDSAAHGLIRVLSTSTAALLGTPLVTTAAYDYAATSGKVEALVAAQKFYQVVVAGVNVAQGNQPTIMTMRQVQLQMGKTIDAISKKPSAFDLTGELIVDKAMVTSGISQFFTFEKA